MKSLGLKMLDEICYLSQMSAITQDERNEYANIIALAMTNTRFFEILRNKLLQKLKDPDFEQYYDLFSQAIETLDNHN